MRREFVEHRGLHLVDALQRDLPALGSRRQVHRAGCQSIPRDVEERAVFGHCVECLERTTRRNPRDKSQAHNERDRQRQGHLIQRVGGIVVRSSQLTAVRSYAPTIQTSGSWESAAASDQSPPTAGRSRSRCCPWAGTSSDHRGCRA